MLKKDQVYSGFRVIDQRELAEYEAQGVHLRHERTGCEVFHVHRDDTENVFCFAFATPPKDDTGAAHIMEHTVLSGSHRFPVKDPFLTLMKGSMNTFLNAMTYPDKTLYPAASILEKDYFNILEVYGDAVFFPLLRKQLFHQEGIRVELSPAGDPTYGGVVYNEMQGNYSSHESIAAEWSCRSLFPDTAYRYDSGGVPEAIPSLNYEQFRAFHQEYYHPSNCRIFLYGNIPTEKQLAFLEERFLSRFEKAAPGAKGLKIAAVQPRWSEPRMLQVSSPLEEEGDGKATITVNWLTVPVRNAIDALSMVILSEILLGNSGSPMNKLITESELGEDVSPLSGIDSDMRDMIFTLGLRGTEPESRDAFITLVFREMERLYRKGFDPDVVEGALRRAEFYNREIRGGVPFGLSLAGKSLRGWMLGAAPWETLSFRIPFAEIRHRFSADPRFFEKLLKKQLLDNPHYSVVSTIPDQSHKTKQDARLRDSLDTLSASLDDRQRAAILEDTAAMKKLQEEPDSPAAIATVPVLNLSDLPPDVQTIDTQVTEKSGVPLYTHDIFTNGILYIDLAVDLKGLDFERNACIPMLSRAICACSLPDTPWDEVARQLALKTGGLYTFSEASDVTGRPGETAEYLYIRLKVLEDRWRDGVKLLNRLIGETLFSEQKRLRDLLLEQRNDFRASILPGGHSLASLNAAACFSRVLTLEDRWRGLEQYHFLNEQVKADDMQGFGQTLESLRRELFTRNRLIVNLTGTGAAFAEAQDSVLDLLTAFGEGDCLSSVSQIPAPHSPGYAATVYTVPSEVNFVAAAMPCSDLTQPNHPGEILVSHLLKTAFLWEEIRMKGGAYGASAAANGSEGVFTFSSYRDPNIAATLESFRRGLETLAGNDIDPHTLEQAVIAVVGRESRPYVPSEKSMIGFRRCLYNINDALRRRKRKALLAADSGTVRQAARQLLENAGDMRAVILAGRDALERDSEIMPSLREDIHALPL